MRDSGFRLPDYDQEVVPLNHSATEIFHECFKSYGGRLPDVADFGPLSQFVEYYKRRYWFALGQLSKELPYVKALEATYFDFIDNQSLNAVASRSMGYDLVGFHSGSILNIS